MIMEQIVDHKRIARKTLEIFDVEFSSAKAHHREIWAIQFAAVPIIAQIARFVQRSFGE